MTGGQLSREHPQWHVWASSTGRLHATRCGLHGPGTGVTVDALSPEGLCAAIQAAEQEAARRP